MLPIPLSESLREGKKQKGAKIFSLPRSLDLVLAHKLIQAMSLVNGAKMIHRKSVKDGLR